MNIEILPFYVGQEVVANNNHSQRAFKKGDQFKVTRVYKNCCYYLVTVGIKSPSPCTQCASCGKVTSIKSDEWVFAADLFSPKIQISEFISMKQVVEQGLELVGAN